jgi:hypothetical protein
LGAAIAIPTERNAPVAVVAASLVKMFFTVLTPMFVGNYCWQGV